MGRLSFFGTSRLLLNLSLFSVTAFAYSPALSPLPPAGEAPHSSSSFPGNWSSGVKDVFGTSYQAYGPSNANSKVWFTGSHGVLTEVYWPSVDQAQVKDSQFLISDGKSFLFQERTDATNETKWIRPGVPVYIMTSRDPQNRFSIQRIIFTDPDRDVVLIKVRLVRNVNGLKFYYLHKPAVANTPFGDTGYVNNSDLPGLYAWEGNQAQALVFSVPMVQVSAGFEGSSDGYQDLASDYIMDTHFEYARSGSVALTGWLDIPDSAGVTEFTIALGFGSDYKAARALAAASLASVDAAQNKYIQGWEGYQAGLRDLSAQSMDGGTLYRSSLALLKSSEDKTHPGAFVASPTIPWGEHAKDYSGASASMLKLKPSDAYRMEDTDRSQQIGGYHLVWPRDLYQISTALLSAGDASSAVAALNYLKSIQFGDDYPAWSYGPRQIARNGGFGQNCWIDGTPYWGGLQMDETAYPVILAYRLWKGGHIQLSDYSDMILRAARFLQKNGPWTHEERWEENSGASPSTIAAEMARELGDAKEADLFRATADNWSSKPGDNVDAWTFTDTGGIGGGKYYMRIKGASSYTATWDPNDEAQIQIKNPGGKLMREKDVLDGGFLELVRLGVRNAQDYHVLQTVHEYDKALRVDTSKGPSYYRYTGDRYNYDDNSGQQTNGMLWPILTGERGTYELAHALAQNISADQVDSAPVPYISAIESFATPSGMIPEQVWDGGDFQGMPTGAATPLGWSHAEYIKLLASRADKKVTDMIPAVTERSSFLMHLPKRQ